VERCAARRFARESSAPRSIRPRGLNGALGASRDRRSSAATHRAEDEGKFVAIDIGTGDYELDKDDYATVTRLRNRVPSAEVWFGRVGKPAAYRMRRSR